MQKLQYYITCSLFLHPATCTGVLMLRIIDHHNSFWPSSAYNTVKVV